MGTMRNDRTSLWSDPQIRATEMRESLPSGETRRAPLALLHAMPVAFGFVGAALVAALGLKIAGMDRAAKAIAWFVPPLLIVGLYEELARRSRSKIELEQVRSRGAHP